MSSRWRLSSRSERSRGRAGIPAAVFFALAAAVAGCSAFDVFKKAPDAKQADAPAPVAVAPTKPAALAAPARIAFDHKFHLSRGPACLDCHEGADKEVKASMPKMEFCADCHTEIDEKKPKEKTLAAFLDKDGKTPIWSRVTAQIDDVVFSHKTHADKKVDCVECHKGIAESTAVGPGLFVDMDACVKCHQTKNAKTECATCHKASAKSVAEGKGQFWPPSNHAASTWRGAHGGVARAGAPQSRAEKCDACHGKDGFPESASCATCHASTKPADHARLWKEVHGQTVRRDPGVVTSRCAFCHESSGFPTQSRCTGCHMSEPPRDHTQSWRVNAGHGLSAEMDRTRCAACHTSDTCAACHSTLAPRSHRGGWGAPRDRHCVGCHLPLEPTLEQGCGVCHQGTPSHATAPAMPAVPPHRPDLQCRQCHTPTRLRHADNGTNCLVCHR